MNVKRELHNAAKPTHVEKIVDNRKGADKGGKKDQEKSKKQVTKKHEQQVKQAQDKQTK